MKQKLVFIVPIFALLGFLAIKPPAIGSEQKSVVVTPTSTSTPLSQPKLRDFDDDGNGPRHFGDDEDGEGAPAGVTPSSSSPVAKPNLRGGDGHDDDGEHGDREHHGHHGDDEGSDEGDDD